MKQPEIHFDLHSFFFLRFHFLILSHLSINMSWLNGKLNGITALEINFLR